MNKQSLRILVGIVAVVGIVALACGSGSAEITATAITTPAEITETAVKTPAEFTVTGINMPPEADVWEKVLVEAVVENTGGETGTFSATLSIDGVAIETKELTIPAGREETVIFEVIRTVGPSAEVKINGLSRRLTINEGVLPSLVVGDTFVTTDVSEGVETAVTLEITGEETIEGVNTYIVQLSFDPAIEGVISSLITNVDIQTFRPLRLEASGTSQVPFSMLVTTIDEPNGLSLYPLSVGKEITVTEIESTEITFSGDKLNETETNTYTYIVEGIEQMTVPAGTFRSFKNSQIRCRR